MIHTHTINARVQITFQYNDMKGTRITETNLDDAINSALHLAINPNFHTIEEATSLLHVKVTCNQESFVMEPNQ